MNPNLVKLKEVDNIEDSLSQVLGRTKLHEKGSKIYFLFVFT